MNKVTQWGDQERTYIANTLRDIAKDADPIRASWLRELALAIDNQ